MNAFEMMKNIGFGSSVNNQLPEGETLVCTISGAGTSSINGDYYTDSANPGCIAKHVSNDYWLRISQYHMGTPVFGYYSYMIYDSPTVGTHYYEWLCTESLTCSSIDITAGASPAPACVRADEVYAVVCHAGWTACNGVYISGNLQNGAFAKHKYNTVYLCRVMGPPDYMVLSPNDYGTGQYYNWDTSTSIPLISNGSDPSAYIYN